MVTLLIIEGLFLYALVACGVWQGLALRDERSESELPAFNHWYYSALWPYTLAIAITYRLTDPKK